MNSHTIEFAGFCHSQTQCLLQYGLKFWLENASLKGQSIPVSVHSIIITKFYFHNVLITGTKQVIIWAECVLHYEPENGWCRHVIGAKTLCTSQNYYVQNALQVKKNSYIYLETEMSFLHELCINVDI